MVWANGGAAGALGETGLWAGGTARVSRKSYSQRCFSLFGKCRKSINIIYLLKSDRASRGLTPPVRAHLRAGRGSDETYMSTDLKILTSPMSADLGTCGTSGGTAP